MKKFFATNMSVLLLALVLVGCSGGDDSSDNSSGNPYVGTWRGVSNNVTITFTIRVSDWTMVGSDGQRRAGTYTYNGNNATFTPDASYNLHYSVTGTLSGNKLTMYDPYYKATAVFTKQN